MTTSKSKPVRTKDDDRKTLGERLRAAREYLGFSQEDVASYLGTSRTALSHMETGQRKVEALELQKLARLYERPLGHFTGGEETEELSFGADVKHLARKASELTKADREELSRFADFLRARKQQKEV